MKRHRIISAYIHDLVACQKNIRGKTLRNVRIFPLILFYFYPILLSRSCLWKYPPA